MHSPLNIKFLLARLYTLVSLYRYITHCGFINKLNKINRDYDNVAKICNSHHCKENICSFLSLNNAKRFLNWSFQGNWWRIKSLIWIIRLNRVIVWELLLKWKYLSYIFFPSLLGVCYWWWYWLVEACPHVRGYHL